MKSAQSVDYSSRLERLKRAVHLVGCQRLAVVQAVENLVNDFLRLFLPIVLNEAVVEVLARQGAADFVLFVVVLKLREVDHLVLALIGGLLVNLEHDPVGLEGHSANPSAAKKRHLYITNNGCGVNRRAAIRPKDAHRANRRRLPGCANGAPRRSETPRKHASLYIGSGLSALAYTGVFARDYREILGGRAL